LERRVLAAHAHRQVGFAIGRGSDFYGPQANSAVLSSGTPRPCYAE
jgi:hypothetical protein